MAFEKFVGSRAAVKGGVRKERRTAESWVKLYPNGGSAVILIFSTEAVREHGLKPGDRVELLFDAEERQVGLRRIDVEAKTSGMDRRTKEYREYIDSLSGYPMLSAHGGKDTVLKLPITEFARTNFPRVLLPYRTALTTGHRKMMVFCLPGKGERVKPHRRKSKPIVPVVPESVESN